MSMAVLVFGFTLRVVQQPFQQAANVPIFNLTDSMWCTIVTMTTVGYGDIYPSTRLGRAVVVSACLFGNFLISLIVVTITNFTDFSAQQLKAYNMIEHQTVLKKTFNTAANLIKSTIRLKNYLTKAKRNTNIKIAKFALKIKNETHLFRKLRTQAQNFEQQVPIDSIINTLSQKVAFSIDALQQELLQLHQTEKVIDETQKFSSQLNKQITDLQKVQNNVIVKINEFQNNTNLKSEHN